MGFPIPSPLGKLIGIALKLPSIFKLLPKLVKTKGGKIGIVVMLGAIAASAAIAKIKEKKAESEKKLREMVVARIEEIREEMKDASAEEQEKLQDQLDTLQAATPPEGGIPMSAEETEAMVETMVEAEIAKVEPQIITALAPFTALIGFPIFLIELMKRLEPFADLGEEVTKYLEGPDGYPDDDGEPGLTAATLLDADDEVDVLKYEDPKDLADGTPEPPPDTAAADAAAAEAAAQAAADAAAAAATGTPTTPATGTSSGGGVGDGDAGTPDENEDPFFDDEYMKWE